MSLTFIDKRAFRLDANGQLFVAASKRLYVLGPGDLDRADGVNGLDPAEVAAFLATETLGPVYEDPEGTIPKAQPIESDSAGRYPYWVPASRHDFYSPDDSTAPIEPWNAGQQELFFHVEDYYSAADVEAKRDLLPMMRALDAAYDAVHPYPWLGEGGGGGYGTVILAPGKAYTIPAGTKDPVDWADPYAAGDRLIIDVARASFIGSKGSRIRTDDVDADTCLLHVSARYNELWGTSSFAGMGAQIGGFAVTGPTMNDAEDAGVGQSLILVESNDANADIAHVTFFNMMVSGGFVGWEKGANAHQIDWRDCSAWFNKVGLLIPAGLTNMGERYQWDGGTFSGNSAQVINRGASSLLFDRMSFDYREGSLDVDDKTALGMSDIVPDSFHCWADDGLTLFTACHLEEGLRDDWPDLEAHARGIVRVDNCRAIIGTKTAAPWAWSDPDTDQGSGSGGGIEVNDLAVHFALGVDPRYRRPNLVEGGGRVGGNGKISHELSGTPTNAARKLLYPTLAKERAVITNDLDTVQGFASAWELAGHSTAAADEPVRDTGTKRTGTASLKFKAATIGNDSVAVLPLYADPGDRILTSFFLKYLGLGGGTESFVIAAYHVRQADLAVVDGVIDTSGCFSATAVPTALLAEDTATGWYLHHGEPILVPGKMGSGIVLLTFALNNVDDIADTIWLDDLVVNCA